MTTATQPTRTQGAGSQLAQREQTARDLDAIANQFAVQLRAEGDNRMMRALVIGQAVNQLRESIKPLMPVFMGLQNSRLGFKTDKADGGYPENVVRDCLVAALLHGVDPTGNEFNIIAGDCYITKEGYTHKCRDIEGISDLEPIPGIPAQHNGQTVVRVAVKCRLNGQPWELKDQEGKSGRNFAIRVNSGMGVDAIVGKSIRKALKAAYEQITGTQQTMPDGDVDESVAPAALQAESAPKSTKTEGLAERLGGTNGKQDATADPDPERATDAQQAAIAEQARRAGLNEKEFTALLKAKGAKSQAKLTVAQADVVIIELRELPTAREPGETENE